MLLLYDKLITGGLHDLSKEQSHHCLGVLRMSVGERLQVSNGAGELFECEIVGTTGKICSLRTLSQTHSTSTRSYSLHLAIAPTKNIDRTEWAIEKAVEIGVDRITMLLTSHSERKTVNMERLERVVISAAGQSLKTYLPRIEPLTRFDDFLRENPCGLIAHCNDGYEKIKIPCGMENYTILIGPEGDFSSVEVDAALKTGYRSITLGGERLRTETAAVYASCACAIFNF